MQQSCTSPMLCPLKNSSLRLSTRESVSHFQHRKPHRRRPVLSHIRQRLQQFPRRTLQRHSKETLVQCSSNDSAHSLPEQHPAPSTKKEALDMQQSWKSKVLQAMANSSDALPYAVVAAAALALFIPSSFAWFTPGMYAPGLGFLMFAVGINLRPEAFKKVLMSPKTILIGNVCQWIIKPLLGLILALTVVPVLGLPHAVGTGVILVSCVSGAQLSNYATFLVHPEQAPLSIVLTALSTAAGVFMTPVLALLLLGARIPVDARGMALSITQIVLVPVLGGLTCSTYFPEFVARAKPFLTAASLLDTCACVGASLASNSETARSAMGLAVLLPVAMLHIAAYYLGYRLARATVAREDVPLARCISLESGMQSSLLGLLLASRFFHDPLVSLPCGISTIFMTLSGFGLVVWWKHRAASASGGTTPASW